tara:strand:+ start:1354 stop:2121 length:768 start_codon:yes stop_codon:yes gene_type:complete
MVKFDNPVIEHKTDHCHVVTFGRLPQMVDCSATFVGALQMAKELGVAPHRVCVLKPASDASKPGFQVIQRAELGTSSVADRQQADGAILLSLDTAVVLPTGDCPAVVINNVATGRMVVFHAGRPALTPPTDCCGCSANIVSFGFRNAVSGTVAEHLRVFITGSISPEHFRHDNEDAQKLVKPFLDTYGPSVFAGDPKDGELDLVGLITRQLIGYGVLEEYIVHDGVCTFSDERLASHRREGRTFRNVTIAINGPI